jgi:hypothetical protein
MVMDCIRRAGETGTIRYDRGQFRLFIEGEHGTRLFLENAYDFYAEPDAALPPGRPGSDSIAAGNLMGAQTTLTARRQANHPPTGRPRRGRASARRSPP